MPAYVSCRAHWQQTDPAAVIAGGSLPPRGERIGDGGRQVAGTAYTYRSRGQRATETKPNGNKVAYRWIEDGLLRSQIETQDLGGKLVSSHALGYNLDGQQSSDVSKVQNADSLTAYLSQTASMVYKADNRLWWIQKSDPNPGSYEVRGRRTDTHRVREQRGDRVHRERQGDHLSD